VLVSALALHFGASLKHALIDRDGSMRRIWPWWPSAGARAIEPGSD
jgi:hypothetical protein